MLTIKALRHVPVLGRPGFWYYKAICLCTCGAEKAVRTASILRGATTSCGCRRDQYRSGTDSPNYRGLREIRGKWWGGLKRDAYNRGLAFEVSLEYAWGLYEGQNRTCRFSGEPISLDPQCRTASIDRTDNTAGYVLGNIQWVHKTVNRMKGTLSPEEFRLLCGRVARYDPSLVSTPTQARIPHEDVYLQGALIPQSKLPWVGQRFGRYVVIEPPVVGYRPYKIRTVLCHCDCGTARRVRTDSLRSGRTLSCGCLQFKGHHDIRGAVWGGYKERASRKGLPFDLILVDAWDLYEAQGRRCALTGIPIGFGTNAKGANTTASLDRIDNGQGYLQGNVQWVDKSINLMRGTLTIQEFQEWCRTIANHTC